MYNTPSKFEGCQNFGPVRLQLVFFYHHLKPQIPFFCLLVFFFPTIPIYIERIYTLLYLYYMILYISWLLHAIFLSFSICGKILLFRQSLIELAPLCWHGDSHKFANGKTNGNENYKYKNGICVFHYEHFNNKTRLRLMGVSKI